MSAKSSSYQHKLKQAADWCALLHSDAPADEDIQAFHQWLNLHPDNQKAYDELTALWTEFETPEDTGLNTQVLNRVLEQDQPQRRHGTTKAFLSIVLFSGLGILFNHLGVSGITADHYTLKGQTQTIQLQDGSQLTLNAQTQIDIKFDDKQRLIKLIKGEIHIDATTNPAWPLVVQTQSTRATALGTSFSVKSREQDTYVVVTESKVKLCYLKQNSCVIGQQGEAMEVANGRLIGPYDTNPSVRLAWLSHRLVANDISLSVLLESLEAHYPGLLMYQHSELSKIRVSGVYPTNNIELAMKMLASDPVIKHQSIANYIHHISLK
ncbi:FecR domain-containing protein [Pseudoalteromonas luteoviolacea]|uniref:FecR family protein n=1 Tax=Pseudoalteromonas luteoviolacea TaxID=43657 RepID=UPI001F250C5D|nr:FecR domain-containing protein [Pseudoalteromonas luteoviolacea]MCF6440912.1 FecR domain-containing protein [Pseudoalteromonas luteoviolacea]